MNTEMNLVNTLSMDAINVSFIAENDTKLTFNMTVCYFLSLTYCCFKFVLCFSYLAVVIDLFARKPVGWAMSHSPDSELTVKVLTMAYELRGRPEGLMFHSDQGSHYTSRKFRQRLWL